MLGLLVIGFTSLMIYTLVKNALFGKQLNAEDIYHGTTELIIPITHRSEFYLEPWLKALSGFQPAHVRIHILIDGHHPSMDAWNELSQKLPNVELHSFLSRPEGVAAVPWMLEKVSSRIRAQVVIIGDAELVPTAFAFSSLGKLVSEKNRPYFTMPQTTKLNLVGESVALINPTLAFASIFGFRKFRRKMSYPLMSSAQGWMGMPIKVFQELNFATMKQESWKQALAFQWEESKVEFHLAFGERQLLRHYNEDFKSHVQQMKTYWSELWDHSDRNGFWIFVFALFVWSFPVLCFFSHPFWSFASFSLLILYRFFSKIVFQESWGAIALHPFACLMWIGTLLWWAIDGAKTKYGSGTPKRF